MKRKIIASILSLVLVSAMLVGCGESSEGTPAAETETPAADDTAKAETPAEEATDAGGGTEIFAGLANGYMGNTWRAQFVEAFETKAEELKQAGVIKDYMSASTDTDVTEQMNQINNMISSGVNLILLNPISPASVTPIQAACDAAGVLLVIDTDPAAVDEELVEVLVDNKQFFEIMTKWFVEEIGGKGNIVQITGTPGMPADLVRQQVVEDILKDYPDIKTLASAPGSWSQTESQAAMSTFLSTYDNIDGVLTQDVMAEGILRAYETAGKQPPIMTGDYVFSFFRKWKDMPDLDACATTFQPHGSAEGLQYGIRILQGKTLKAGTLGPNPLDESMINAINMPPAYGVTYEAAPADATWKQGYDLTEFITCEEAVTLGEGQPDTASLGKTLPDSAWDDMFE
ncbi:substrate-binding domain-containing protein [Lachnospiraceae bacterium ZAX-1]